MARFPGAVWVGPVPGESPGRMVRPILGQVEHIEQGTEAGTNTWFHNPASQASAHFGVAKDGSCQQFVDTADKAWAEADGNSRHISVEHEGMSGESLTPQQLETTARILAWGHVTEGFALQVSDDVTGQGDKYHGLGGDAWGGHPDCPGAPIVAQRQQIVDRAKAIISGPPPHPPVPRPPQPMSNVVLAVQAAVHAAKDGQWGPNTEARISRVRAASFTHFLGDIPSLQQIIGTTVDGGWGPKSAAALKVTVELLQQAFGVARDGDWGPKTDAAYFAARKKFYH